MVSVKLEVNRTVDDGNSLAYILIISFPFWAFINRVQLVNQQIDSTSRVARRSTTRYRIPVVLLTHNQNHRTGSQLQTSEGKDTRVSSPAQDAFVGCRFPSFSESHDGKIHLQFVLPTFPIVSQRLHMLPRLSTR